MDVPLAVLADAANAAADGRLNILGIFGEIRSYGGFGFEVVDQGKHTKYRHPRYPDLWTMIPRSDPLSKSYAEDAIEIIDELRRREADR